MTKGPCRHRETWWWDEEVAEAVREKKIEFYKSHPFQRWVRMFAAMQPTLLRFDNQVCTVTVQCGYNQGRLSP